MTALEQNTLSLKKALPMVAIGLFLSFLISQSDMIIPMALTGIAAILFALFLIGRDIKWGFYFLISAGFFSVGITRYAPLPLGLMIDFILVGIFLIYFFKEFKNLDWTRLNHPVFFAVFTWMVINCMELVNPESRSFEAWFYAMRGVSLYFFLTVVVGFLCLQFKNDFGWFINIWFVCSIIGTLWGMKQLYIGLDGAEKAWLEVPGNLSTHMLFGRLRVFSFYSDAGQFGASQAHTALVACILAVNEKLRGRKIFYTITALLCTYGMLISGTRGAIAIPIVGLFTYFILIRNFKIIIIGSILFASAFGVLKFTFIGQGVYQINRMRTALNPNDASFNVRLENQKKLREYLNHHILGGGIGSAGYWGQRFSPGTFLANLALDSWYVRIAAEFGYVGLLLYIVILIVIVFQCWKTISTTKDDYDRGKLIAIFCGLTGILVASYTNQVFGQIPTATLVYISIVFLSKPQTEETHAKLA